MSKVGNPLAIPDLTAALCLLDNLDIIFNIQGRQSDGNFQSNSNVQGRLRADNFNL
jgi:hypothetical protein